MNKLFIIVAVGLFLSLGFLGSTATSPCDNYDSQGIKIVYCPENGGEPYLISKENPIKEGVEI